MAGQRVQSASARRPCGGDVHQSKWWGVSKKAPGLRRRPPPCSSEDPEPRAGSPVAGRLLFWALLTLLAVGLAAGLYTLLSALPIALGADRLLPDPPAGPPESKALVSVTPQLKEVVLRDLLQVRNHEAYLKDPSCAGLVMYMASAVMFQFEYKALTLSWDKTGDRPVEFARNQLAPKDLQGFTIRDLGHKLYADMKAHARVFCQSYQVLQRVFTKELDALDEMITQRELSGSKDALDEPKVMRRLQFDKLSAAIAEIRKDRTHLVEEAHLFLENIHRQNNLSFEAQELLAEVKRLLSRLEKHRREKLRPAAGEAFRTEGEVRRLAQQVEDQSRAKAGGQELVKYWEGELRAVDKLLEQAHADVKQYTFFMYGKFVATWVNDVELAKSKVTRFEARKAEVEGLIQALRLGTSEPFASLHQEAAEAQGKLAEATKVARSAREAYLEETREHQRLKEACEEKRRRMDAMLKAQGAHSFQHLLRAQQAIDRFGNVAARDTEGVAHIADDWAADLLMVQDMLEEVAKAQSLRDQRAHLGRVRQLLAQRKIPVLSMIRDTSSKFTLVPGPNEMLQIGAAFDLATEDDDDRGVDRMLTGGEAREVD